MAQFTSRETQAGGGDGWARGWGPRRLSPPRPQGLEHLFGLPGQPVGDRGSARPCPFKPMGECWGAGRAWFLALLPAGMSHPVNQWEGRTGFPPPLST